MFKLVVLSAFLAIASAKPSPHATLLQASPLFGSLISEKTIESHGNTVVHGTAPVVHAAAVPAIAYSAAPVVHAVQPAHLVAEKTIESHGNTVVHGSAPAVLSYAAAVPAVNYVHAVHQPATLISEKSVSNYGHSIVHHGAPIVQHISSPVLAYSAPAATYAHPAISVW